VYVVKGMAKVALDAAPPDIKLPAFYLDRIIANMEKSSRVIPESQLGDIHERMLSRRSFTALHVVPGKQDVSIVGNAVFSSEDNRMVGALDGEDVEGRNLITGEYYSGAIKAKFRDGIFTYNITKVKSSIELEDPTPENLKVTIKIKVEGNISETFEQADFFHPGVLEELESLIEDELVRLTERAVIKCQKEYETDVLGLSEYLSKRYPKLWVSVKNDWETGMKYFTKSDITIKPEAQIRTSGVIIKSR